MAESKNKKNPDKEKGKATDPKKNIVLVLVEGESDQKALQLPLQALYNEIDPRINVIFATMLKPAAPPQDSDDDPPEDLNSADDAEDEEDDEDEDIEVVDDEDAFGGDITTTRGVWPGRIEQKISAHFFVPIIKREKIYAKNLLKVIQIVDLDGAYLPDTALRDHAPERAGMSGFWYNTGACVIEGDTQRIARRNFHKRCNLDALVSKNIIHIQNKQIPYEIYFFSCNLDHVLHEDANLPHWDKVSMAKEFAMDLADDIDAFCDFFNWIVPEPFSGLGYEESWDLVRDRKQTYSIGRNTNLHLLLNKLRNEIGKK